MTQEEKELLLQDLCGRLLYEVFVEYDYGDGVKRATKFHGNYLYLMMIGKLQWKDFKPYLRPMSSMTEEEFGFLQEHLPYDFTRIYSGKFDLINDIHIGNSISIDDIAFLLECLNKWHFDYRGLISMGLGLEAPKDMYDTKTE